MKSVNPFRALRRIAILGAVATLVVAAPATAREASSFPDVISLPNGWRPEGLVVGRGSNVYVGSLANGAIWHGDLRTGQGDILYPGGTGEVTVGLEHDQHDRIWAAGGATGVGKVFDATTGTLLRMYSFVPSGGFINDVVVTHDAAYFTNTTGGQLFAVPLGAGGALPASGTFPPTAIGAANPNGIETTPDNKALLMVSGGALFRFDPATGITTQTSLGGADVVNGDGLVRQGRTLYVVQNRSNRIAVVTLNADGTAGTVQERLGEGLPLDVPSTADLFGNAIYAVNARFGAPMTPDTPYHIVRVER